MYKILLFLLIIPLSINAINKEGKYTKKKTISKEFIVNKDATLNVSNKYGNINIVAWNQNRIVIDVTITTSGNNEEKVEKRLEQIDVQFENSSNYVSAKTKIEKASSSWSFWGKSYNVSMEINYEIKMPVTNNVDLSNDYGGISLDKLEGTCKIDCDYGKIEIGELLNSKNSINMDYTNKSNIDFMQNGTINADYSTLNVENSGNVKLNADYSHLSFGTVKDLDYNCDYGSLKIQNADKLNGDSDYMHSTIENLNVSGVFDMDYGGLKIRNIGAGIKNINVNSSYTSMRFGASPNASFNIVASLSYGSFKYGNGFTLNKEIEKSSSKYYEGYFNKPNSTATISIKSSYGNISFN